jgi:hypothetical protein
MAYSFFPNDFNKTPNLQDQLFLMKQKQAAELNEYYAPSREKDAKPRDFDADQKRINQFLPSRRTGEEYKPQPSLIPPAGTVLPSSFKKPRPEGGFPKKEVIDQSKPSGSIAGGLGISPEAPTKPRRGVTKSGKMITITSDKRPESRYIDGSGMSNEYRDKDGNVHIAYGVRSGPPEGMSRHGEDYVDVGDDFDDKTSNPTEYYTTKSKKRDAAMASFKQSLSRGNREKPYIQ